MIISVLREHINLPSDLAIEVCTFMPLWELGKWFPYKDAFWTLMYRHRFPSIYTHYGVSFALKTFARHDPELQALCVMFQLYPKCATSMTQCGDNIAQLHLNQIFNSDSLIYPEVVSLYASVMNVPKDVLYYVNCYLSHNYDLSLALHLLDGITLPPERAKLYILDCLSYLGYNKETDRAKQVIIKLITVGSLDYNTLITGVRSVSIFQIMLDYAIDVDMSLLHTVDMTYRSVDGHSYLDLAKGRPIYTALKALYPHLEESEIVFRRLAYAAVSVSAEDIARFHGSHSRIRAVCRNDREGTACEDGLIIGTDYLYPSQQQAVGRVKRVCSHSHLITPPQIKVIRVKQSTPKLDKIHKPLYTRLRKFELTSTPQFRVNSHRKSHR